MTTENSIDGLSIRPRFADLRRASKWINQHGTPMMLLILLLGMCAWAQSQAAAMIAIERELGIGMHSLNLRRVVGIEFIHSHWWFALPYVAIFAGSLTWLEARHAPRWAVWAVFMIMTLPCLRYMWACIAWAV